RAVSVAPLRLTEPPPAVATIVPPPQVPERPEGVATTTPPGRVSVKPMPVRVDAAFGFAIVKARLEVPLSATLTGVNVLLTVGGAGVTAALPVRVAVAPAPAPPSVDVTVLVVLGLVPAVVPVTLTEKVHEPPPARVAPLRATEPLPAVAAIVPPPQAPLRPFG